MYKVSVYDTSKKLIAVYEHIHTIKYLDVLCDEIAVTGSEILVHSFPTDTNYQLLSDNGNYSISKSIIGTFEVTKED